MDTQRICNAMGETGNTLKMKAVIDLSEGFKVEEDRKLSMDKSYGLAENCGVNAS